MSDTFRMTFYGTRGSRTVCGPQYTKWGGHTTCLGVQAGDRQLIFDAGSGIVQLGEEMVKGHFSAPSDGPLVSYLLQTHAHYDHICGLPYFVPLYIPDATTYIYGPRNPYMSFQETIERFIHPPYHPVPFHEMHGTLKWGEVTEPESLYFVKGQEEPVVVNLRHSQHMHEAPDIEDVETVVHTMHGYNHPKCGVTIYRVEHAGRSIVFATDVEGYVLGDQRLIQFAAGANVLIHDAMYTKERYAGAPGSTQGWGHSTVEIAAEVASAAEVDHLYLVHHDPGHSDDELARMGELGREFFKGTISAQDGMSLDLIETFPTA